MNAPLINLPVRNYGKCTQLCVREFGAVGDGVHDDTAAFAAAVKALPPVGGTVFMPDGRYLIAASPTASWLRSKMRLLGDANAFILTKPNNAPRGYPVLLDGLDNVVLENVRVIGDRLTHQNVDVDGKPNTHEWNHGIAIRGSSSAISLINCSTIECGGDGVSLGGTDIVVYRLWSQYNRRQALTIGRAKSPILIYDCDLIDTGDYKTSLGTKPMAGMDIEPDAPYGADGVTVKYCRIMRNHAGIEIYASNKPVNGTLATAKNIAIENNDIGFNTVGVMMTRASGIGIRTNYIHDQKASGVQTGAGVDKLTIANNTFENNYTKDGTKPRASFSIAGTDKRTTGDILLQYSPTNVTIPLNVYK